MAYCQGCGAYVGDYSFYRHKTPGKGEIVLCFRCNRWAERHPALGAFPPRNAALKTEKRRIGTLSKIYIIGSLGIFAAGAVIVLAGSRTGFGLVILLGAISLFSVGWGMRGFARAGKEKQKDSSQEKDQ